MDFTKQELLDLFGLEVQVVDAVVHDWAHYCDHGKPITCRWLAVKENCNIGRLRRVTGLSRTPGTIVWGTPDDGRLTTVMVPTSYFEAGVQQYVAAVGYAPVHCENDKPIFVDGRFAPDDDGWCDTDAVWYIDNKLDALGFVRVPKPGEENLRVHFSIERSSWESWCEKHGVSIWSIYMDKMGDNVITANQDGTYTFDAFRAFEEEDIRKLKAEINARA